MDVTIEGRNGGVSIRVDKKRWIKRNRVSVMMKVRVPEAFNLKIDTLGGSIRVGHAEGDVQAGTMGGNINVDSAMEPARWP